MVLPNAIALFALSGMVIATARNHKKGDLGLKVDENAPAKEDEEANA
jgi:hypothetical protein